MTATEVGLLHMTDHVLPVLSPHRTMTWRQFFIHLAAPLALVVIFSVFNISATIGGIVDQWSWVQVLQAHTWMHLGHVASMIVFAVLLALFEVARHIQIGAWLPVRFD